MAGEKLALQEMSHASFRLTDADDKAEPEGV
jgi:hypothetical protein